jgi:hypothetical protein
MQKSNVKLLLSAEPFGFGPSAAIATFFPHLQKKFKHISFIGSGHTLDLQRTLPYDSIHNSTDADQEKIRDILKQYDLVLTATDFAIAKQAQDLGIPTIIYDPLTWYWDPIPKTIGKAKCYIAQDFIDVRSRIQKYPEQFPNAHIVAPIVKKKTTNRKEHVLVNLGGLQNPFMTQEQVITYAKAIIFAVRMVHGERAIIAANKNIVTALRPFGAKVYAKKEIDKILSSAALAIMTPGLGNIYDAASYGTPTIWLPPANDTQGRQLQLLMKHKLADAALDWTKFLHKINYYEKQEIVMENIAKAVQEFAHDDNAQERLKHRISSLSKSLIKKRISNTAKLMEQYGSGGAQQVAEIVEKQAEEL